MPRNLTSEMLVAFSSAAFSPALFISIGFYDFTTSTNSTVYVWSGYGPITWNGNAYTGLGTLLSIGEQLEDASTVEARGVTITFSGLDATLLPDALTNLQLGLPVNIWLAVMSGGAPISSPVILWSGATDLPQVEVSGTDASISINCENLLVSMNVPVDRRYTLQDSTELYPGDLGFNFVNAIQETTINWGTKANSNATNSPSFVSRHESLLLGIGASGVA